MKVLKLSPSMLATISRCGTKALLSTQGWDGQSPNAAMTVGSIFHRCLAIYLTGSSRLGTLALLDHDYRMALNAGLLAQDEEEGELAEGRFALDNLGLILDEWLERYPVSKLPFKVQSVEIPFEAKLGEIYSDLVDENGESEIEVRVIGVFDGYAYDSNGEMVVVEHKTTGKRLNERYMRDFQIDAQNTAYIWAANQMTGGKVLGAYVNAMRMFKLPSDPKRKCYRKNGGGHGVPYSECGRLHAEFKLFPVSRSYEQLEEWKNQVLTIFAPAYLEALESGDPSKMDMRGRFNGECSGNGGNVCAYREWCDAGRPLQYIGSMLAKRKELDATRPRSGLYETRETAVHLESVVASGG